MNNKATKRLRLIYGIAVSVMAVVSGLLLMAACLQIYHSGGEQIYTPEKVVSAFSPIALPIYITLALIAGSFLLDLLLPVEKKRNIEKQHSMLLRKAYDKADVQACDPELKQELAKEQSKRCTAMILSLAVWLVGAVIFLPYAMNSKNYSPELHLATNSVIAVVWRLLPCVLIPLGCSIFTAYFSRASIRRELDLVKLAPKLVDKTVPAPGKASKNVLYIQVAILGIALGLTFFGFMTGGTADVLAKAVAICTECVGLG